MNVDHVSLSHPGKLCPWGIGNSPENLHARSKNRLELVLLWTAEYLSKFNLKVMTWFTV